MAIASARYQRNKNTDKEKHIQDVQGTGKYIKN